MNRVMKYTMGKSEDLRIECHNHVPVARYRDDFLVIQTMNWNFSMQNEKEHGGIQLYACVEGEDTFKHYCANFDTGELYIFED